VLDRFEEVGLVDDGEFAAMLVRSQQATRGLGRRALAQELRRKGVDDEVAREALEHVDDEDEESTARSLVARRLASTRGLSREKRMARLAGMLARKGYPSGLAVRVVREALAADGHDASGADGDDAGDDAGDAAGDAVGDDGAFDGQGLGR
jgi:regulatory protein